MKKYLLLLLIFLMPLKVQAFSASATSAILMDQDSKRILYSDNIHKVRSVASISKIMTAILAIESDKLEQIITVDDVIDQAYGSNIYIKEGEQIKLIDLVYGLMLRSGNDASLVIAKHVGGSVENFVKLMNEKAKKIGMKNTTFNNPNGLDQDKGNYSTAYDMAILTSYAMQNDIYKKVVKTKKHTVKTNLNYYSWTNKNKLLNNKYITGGKTGFTEKAKRTLVSTATKNGLNLVVVTLNDGNDFQDHQNLYNEAFTKYTNYKILSKGVINVPDDDLYEKGTLFLNENKYYPLTKDEVENIVLNIKLDKKITEGKVGLITAKIEDKELVKTEVYYKTKPNKNWIQKIIGWFKKW